MEVAMPAAVVLVGMAPKATVDMGKGPKVVTSWAVRMVLGALVAARKPRPAQNSSGRRRPSSSACILRRPERR